jgi:hypothetical protein
LLVKSSTRTDLETAPVLGFMLGNRHIADLNQNIAEPHAAIIAPASMNGLILTPYWFGWVVIILAITGHVRL